MEVITTTNRKGGVAKTETAHNIGYLLAQEGKKVLMIDLDSQCSLTKLMLEYKPEHNAMDVLSGTCAIDEAIVESKGLSLLAGNSKLSNAAKIFVDTGREYILKEALEPVKGNYDFIIIDTPPELSILTINALVASNSILIPTTADFLSMDCIMELKGTFDQLRKYCNKDLVVKGIILTRFSSRTILARDMQQNAQKIAEQLGTKLFKATIPECNAVREAQAKRSCVSQYAPFSTAGRAYKELVKELLA